MKKTALSFIFLLSILFLCSCNKNDELGKNSIVTTVYADFNNRKYTFWAETTSFLSEEKEDAVLYTAEGITPDEAWLKLKSEFPDTPYFGHLKAIVLGEGFFRESTKPLLKFLLSENSLSPNAAIYITNKKPQDFSIQSIGKMSANKSLPVIELYTFFSPSSYCSDIPILEIKDKQPLCRSTAVIENFSYKYTLSDNYFDIYSIIKNRNYIKFYHSFEIKESSSHIKTKNKKLHLGLKINFGTFVSSSDYEIKNLIKKDIKALISHLVDNKLSYILTNETFEGYTEDIKILTEESSKIRYRK